MKRIMIVAAGLAALAGCSSGTVTATTAGPVVVTVSPQPTGPYSTAGLSGTGCKHTGPGWVIIGAHRPAIPGQAKVYRVRDAYYCTAVTGGAMILSDGRKFNEYLPWEFSRTPVSVPPAG